MPQSIEGPVVNTQTPKGVVQVRVTVPATLGQAWNAITDRDLIGRWFGDLSGNLTPGAKVRLDFGDADFFAIENISLSSPTRMTYAWRFLATGPRNAIAWQIDPQSGSECIVTVTDTEPLRTPETVKELQGGWSDFLGRLQRFLTTGKISRYDWRRDFDGSAELSASAADAWSTLFSSDCRAQWLPFDIPLKTGAIKKGRSSPEWLVTVEHEEDFELSCEVRSSQWLQATSCHLKVSQRGQWSILSVSHTGWQDISADPSYCMRERRAFGALWIQALQRAEKLVGAAQVQ